MSSINQKEYLKKYLGIGKGSGDKKKKKKKVKTGTNLRIIDDDIDVSLNDEIQEDLTANNEDAPQIVAVIDERPANLKMWKPIGEVSENVTSQTEPTIKLGTTIKLKKGDLGSKTKSDMSPRRRKGGGETSPPSRNRDSDISPPRRNRGGDISPPRRHKSDGMSPPRGNRGSGVSPHTVHKSDDVSRRNRGCDFSPPKSMGSDTSPPRKNSVSDISPPRRHKGDDISPHRRKRADHISPVQRIKIEDVSPPRKPKQSNQDISPSRRHKGGDTTPSRGKRGEEVRSPLRKFEHSVRENSSPRKRRHDDVSPPRETKVSPPTHSVRGVSPPRRHLQRVYMSPTRKKEADGGSPPRDMSPPRKKKVDDNSPPRDMSPPRKRKVDDSSLPRKKKVDDSSPPRHMSPSHERKKDKASSPRGARKRKSRWGADSDDEPKKMDKTLDGKKAGLQDARKLAEETANLKIREDEMFKNMSAEFSGAGASTVVRRKKKDVDPEEEEMKRKREEETREKYQQWGKGLKQVDNRNRQVEEELHEMSKPLARYADDEDLEKYLKEQEREGDPMLAYLRKKKKKVAVESGLSENPTYQGEFMPNRFGIRPGYRWDGVDRSNGYERKYFEVQNKKKADLEESYKWSTEDM